MKAGGAKACPCAESTQRGLPAGASLREHRMTRAVVRGTLYSIVCRPCTAAFQGACLLSPANIAHIFQRPFAQPRGGVAGPGRGSEKWAERTNEAIVASVRELAGVSRLGIVKKKRNK